ncbi:hypothetical protein [Thermomonospora amylolytica]|uniref:hypothetical protein n=1 Tax=Thermomonospora amylolytica TaxID=1411117 RepID=UPI000E6B97AE|nr:hypothetical protein [Thermomonospora amylolytica]
MGYSFSCAGAGRAFDIPGHEMIDVREVLRLAVHQAGPDCPVQMHKFESNDGWHVTPEECRAIARLLGGPHGELMVSDYLSFVDEVSDGLIGNVRDLAEFSALAADNGGFDVT